MTHREFAGIHFKEPNLQAEFERLLAAVDAAEQARAPLAQRQSQAERNLDRGEISDRQFGEADRAFISANNKIAAAKKAVDAFLSLHHNYDVTD